MDEELHPPDEPEPEPNTDAEDEGEGLPEIEGLPDVAEGGDD